MTEELVKYEATPAVMMIAAIEKGLDLDKIAKAMELQAEWEKREVAKAYHVAMSAFKANPPEIEKDRHVKFTTQKGTTEYTHASLANVTTKINAVLSNHELSASWSTSQEGVRITVTCKITHAKGHSESTSLSASPDDSGGKNAIQAIGSTISYLERYTLLALTGLATHDMDDDGKGTEPEELITAEQVESIKKQLAELDRTPEKFCKYLKVESLDKIPAKRLKEVETVLKDSIKAKKKAHKKPDPVQKADEDLKKLIADKNKALGVDRQPGEEG